MAGLAHDELQRDLGVAEVAQLVQVEARVGVEQDAGERASRTASGRNVRPSKHLESTPAPAGPKPFVRHRM